MSIKIPKKFLSVNKDSSSLAFFRIGFGILMCFSIIRFWLKGWIKSLYIDPQFHFSYYVFEWVKPIEEYTYLIFVFCFVAAFMVMIGLKYRAAIICFFLSFTYIELMDKTTYLNHYYFISMLSFLMIFLPLNASFSLDNYLNKKKYLTVPSWCLMSIKLFVALIYIYAGIAKLNLSPYEMIATLAVFYILLGLFLEGISITVMSLPISLPLVLAAGFDPIWFGIFLVIMVELAQITPPVGFNLFIIHGLTGTPIMRVAIASAPFFILMCCAAAIITIFPQIALWLPDTLFNK